MHWWAPWEHITADIGGDHLITATNNGRLYLFWPVFALRNDDGQATDTQQPATKHVEVTMAYVAYREAATADRHGRHRAGSWSAKRTSVGQPVTVGISAYESAEHLGRLLAQGSDPALQPPDPSRFTFVVAANDDESLVIDCRLIVASQGEDVGSLTAATFTVGSFRMDACRPGLFGVDGPADGDLLVPDQRPGLPRALPEGERLREDAATSLALRGEEDALFLMTAFSNGHGQEGHLRWTPPILERTGPTDTNGSLSTFHLTGGPGEAVAIGKDVLVFDDGDARSFLVSPVGPSRAAGDPPGALRYRFESFYHPYLCAFTEAFNSGGIDGLLRWTGQRSVQQLRSPDGWFAATYQPIPGRVATAPDPRDLEGFLQGWGLPDESVDFGLATPYGGYNWELFFHAPLLVATQLSANGRHAEAQRWFHFIFDPRESTDDTSPAPGRYWRVLPFTQHTEAPVDALLGLYADLLNHSGSSGSLTPALLRDVAGLVVSVAMWRDRPFEPHLLARTRPTAYQKTVVIRYVQNLMDWADSLYRQDTLETLAEATQLYLFAAEILGEEPAQVTDRSEPSARSWNEIHGLLDAIDNPLVKLENHLVVGRPDLRRPASGLGRRRPMPPVRTHYGFYFCIPRNEKLTQMRSLLAQRLFNLRHCRNIDGVQQQLPLYEPPIDPGLLVRAIAGGADLSQPLALTPAAAGVYRFRVLLAKAVEFCTDVKAYGALLLSALDRRDAEGLALLRADHEVRLLDAVHAVRMQQVDEASAAIETLNRARIIAQKRRDHYQSLVFMNPSEVLHVEAMAVSLILQYASQALEQAASGAFAFPNEIIGGAGISSPVELTMLGGGGAGAALQSDARTLAIAATISTGVGSIAGTIGGYQRRAEDWALQIDVAEAELDHVDAQLAVAQLRLAIVTKELANHELQQSNAEAARDYLTAKFTNRELYDWMVAQAATSYHQSYDLAVRLARRAEAAHHFEIGVRPDAATTFIEYGYWDSLRKGLLAGERLAHDLRRLEAAYLDGNVRRLEIGKNVSLGLAAPEALYRLRTSGFCTFDLPEEMFDADFPGQYLRRIKTVSVSIPCVTGPYTGVHGILTLTGHDTRFADDAQRDHPLDPHHSTGDPPAIAISTSAYDSGLFETNLQDERYLPFEGRGAVSSWLLEVSPSTNRFDPQSIADVVLHLRYTAAAAPPGYIAPPSTPDPGGTGLRLFSARHDFADQWRRFVAPPPNGTRLLELPLTADRFGYLAPGAQRQITLMKILAVCPTGPWTPADMQLTPAGATALHASLTTDVNAPAAIPSGSRSYDTGFWQLSPESGRFDVNRLADIAIIVGYADQ